MPNSSATHSAERQHFQHMTRDALQSLQLEKCNRLLAEVLPQNRFYADKLRGYPTSVRDWAEFRQLPLTTKQELIPEPGEPSFARNLTYPTSAYVRYHRTSGTHGRPLVILDTPVDWQWWIRTWQYVLDVAQITADDRVAMAFSFGPFIGFWTANDALAARGALVVPCGGMSSLARLELILAEQITAVCCTPSYALHLAQLAREQNWSLRDSAVRVLIVAGEPGGSLPAVRDQIRAAWNADLIDHAGATEVGPWGFADSNGQGLRIVESEFIAEFLDLDSPQPAAWGSLAELVLTNLGRPGAPVLRYRTGDLVRPVQPADHGGFVLLDGGVLGRTDDMLIVRGVNIFPSALEQILREFPEVQEYQVLIDRTGAMDAVRINVEDRAHAPERIAQRLQVRLGLHIEVVDVPAGTLPRFEHKAKRWMDRRP